MLLAHYFFCAPYTSARAFEGKVLTFPASSVIDIECYKQAQSAVRSFSAPPSFLLSREGRGGDREARRQDRQSPAPTEKKEKGETFHHSQTRSGHRPNGEKERGGHFSDGWLMNGPPDMPGARGGRGEGWMGWTKEEEEGKW